MCVIIMPLFSALHLFKGALLHFGLEAPPALVSVCNCHQTAASAPLLSSSPLAYHFLSSPLLSSLLLAPRPLSSCSMPLPQCFHPALIAPICGAAARACPCACLLLYFRFSQFSSLASLSLIHFTKS